MASKKSSSRSGAGRGRGARKAPLRGKKAAKKAAIPRIRPAAAPAPAFSSLLSDPASADFLRQLIGLSTAPASLLPETGVEGLAAGTPALGASSEMLGTRLSAVRASSTADLSEMPVKVQTSMDPRLQLAVANHRTGKRGLALASTTGEEVAVVARVKSADDWRALPDVVPGSVLGRSGDGWIVTGRAPVRRVEALRAESTVLSLKASQPVRPELAATIQAMGVAPASLPSGVSPNGGNGVVIGIVDFGCDFAHQNFRLPNGKTRLLALWNQAGIASTASPFGYGRMYSRGEIDVALSSPTPYLALGYGPKPDNAFQTGTHGTHVMDIAAGNGRGSTQAGVAPKADIVFVEASVADVAWQGPAAVGSVFGDSVQLLEGVRFIFDTAGDRPCVCNLSLGTNGGPHDGSSLVEQGLDALVREKPNRAIVIAASNSQTDDIHTSGQIPANGSGDLVWQQRNAGGGEFELWYPAPSRLEVSLIAPDGTVFGPCQPGNNRSFGSAGQIAIFISNRLGDPNNGDNVIGIWLAAGLSAADWTIRLKSLAGGHVEYHAWIERNDPAQASFASPVPTHTLGSISTGHESIVVGSYDAHKPGLPLSSFSSSGPTRDGRKKPEVSAPGHDVIAARSRTKTGVVRKSGTSMAAPAVTGLVALILAEARRNGSNLSISALRDRLIQKVLGNPPASSGWHARYGNGRANAKSI